MNVELRGVIIVLPEDDPMRPCEGTAASERVIHARRVREGSGRQTHRIIRSTTRGHACAMSVGHNRIAPGFSGVPEEILRVEESVSP